MMKNKNSNELLDSPLVPQAFFSAQRLIIFFIAITLGSLAVIFGARPLYHEWQRRTVNQLVAQSEALLAQEKYGEASNILIKAYQKDKSSPLVLRSIAKLLGLSKTDQERALFFWRALLDTGEATLEDRMNMGQVYTATGRVAEAAEILKNVPREDRSKREPMELEAALMKLQGRGVEADALLRRGLALEPNNLDAQIKLAKLDLNSSFNEANQKALGTLWTIARGNGSEALKALDILAAESPLTVQQTEELLVLSEKHLKVSERHRLLALTAYLRLHPLQKADLIKKETARHEGMSIEESADFLGWLDGLNEHGLVLSFIKQEKALRAPELFTVYSNALASENRWAELQEILKRKAGAPVSGIAIALLNARCSNGLGESVTIIRGHLSDAIHKATLARNTPAVLQTAQLADKLGYNDMAIEAFQSLANQPQYHLAMLEQIYRIHMKQRLSDEMLATLQEILKARPEQLTYALTNDYLKLIIGMDMEEAMLDCEATQASDPQSKPLRQLLLALSAYRRSDFRLATVLASGLDATSLSAGQRAVLAGILKACGDDHRAYGLAEKVPTSLLLPEELVFLKKAL